MNEIIYTDQESMEPPSRSFNEHERISAYKNIRIYDSICAVLDTTEMNCRKSIEFLYEQWRCLTAILNSSILAACNQSNYIKQTFQNEYPKLLKLQNDLWLRLLQMNPLIDHYRYIDMQAEKNKLKNQENSKGASLNYSSSYELLRKCFYDLENSYLNRSLAHLFDPINLIFSQSIEKPINRADIETYMKGVQTQLQTLQCDICNAVEAADGLSNPLKMANQIISGYTSTFSDKIVANICKSIQMYANKSEQALNSLNFDSDNNLKSNFAGGSDKSSESFNSTKNLEYVNLAQDLYEQMNLMFANEKLNQKLEEKLNMALKCLLTFEENAIKPIISSVLDYINAILLTMHQEEFQSQSQTFSLYIKELQQVLQRVCRDYLKLFNCKSILTPYLNQLAIRCIELFIRHASILRPMTDSTRKRLVNDSEKLENIIQTILCPKLTDLGIMFKQLKAFRHLLVISSPFDAASEQPSSLGPDLVDEAHYGSVINESLPYSILLHYLFSYAPSDFKSPHQSLDWSITKYSDWLDKHSNEKDRILVVKTCLEAYVNLVRQRNEKKFTTIYPLMCRLLEKSLQS